MNKIEKLRYIGGYADGWTEDVHPDTLGDGQLRYMIEPVEVYNSISSIGHSASHNINRVPYTVREYKGKHNNYWLAFCEVSVNKELL